MPGTGESGGRRRRRGRRKSGGDAPEGDAPTEPERPLTAEERLQHALKLSYQHLTKRDRTVSEVRAHLEKRAVDEASIAGALAELVEFRYLDDERYAARFVEDKRRLEGWGHLRIAQGLRRTGIDREIADRAVADDPLRDDEAELAVETLQQRLDGRPPEDDRGRQKALRMLATKGYPLETAYAAVRTYEQRCAERAG
ncbi:regulatory protein RecX [Patulibacter sp. NPDC049589]|uniref:regulatory protein RecX n=1 Tax=Patulibacter sp. NPDC049589 TaxID=3154731 RepID=UPI0034184949